MSQSPPHPRAQPPTAPALGLDLILPPCPSLGSPLLRVLLLSLWGGRGGGRALSLFVVASLLVPPVRVRAVHLGETGVTGSNQVERSNRDPHFPPPWLCRPALTSSVSVLAEIFFLRATGLFSSVTS